MFVLVSLPCWLQGWQELPAVQWKLLLVGLSLRAQRRPEHFAKSTFAGRFGCNSLPRSDSVLIAHECAYHAITTRPPLFSKVVVLFVLYDNLTGSYPLSLALSLSHVRLSSVPVSYAPALPCVCVLHTFFKIIFDQNWESEAETGRAWANYNELYTLALSEMSSVWKLDDGWPDSVEEQVIRV